MKSEIPVEVAKYFSEGRRTLVALSANEDFTLKLTFDNGEVRLYDMTRTVTEGVF